MELSAGRVEEVMPDAGKSGQGGGPKESIKITYFWRMSCMDGP